MLGELVHANQNKLIGIAIEPTKAGGRRASGAATLDRELSTALL
jgi:hypothetical protein